MKKRRISSVFCAFVTLYKHQHEKSFNINDFNKKFDFLFDNYAFYGIIYYELLNKKVKKEITLNIYIIAT